MMHGHTFNRDLFNFAALFIHSDTFQLFNWQGKHESTPL